MKSVKGKRFLGLFLAISMMFSTTATAAMPRASDQLGAYEVNAVACGSGKLAIAFSVEGTGIMDSIGAEKIKIYEAFGSDGWMLVRSIGTSTSGMTASNKNLYGTTMYYNGISGVEYKVQVTIFATNSKGTDSRTLTRYVTA